MLILNGNLFLVMVLSVMIMEYRWGIMAMAFILPWEKSEWAVQLQCLLLSSY